MIPVWCACGRRAGRDLSTRQVPLLSIGAAFCFTIMMFNVPAPGGTSVHPVGGVLLAVMLGPWAATIGMTVALVIQALFFGDGGVFAGGANCFSMAFAMPFSGYLAYRLIAGRSAVQSPRRAVAAGAGAYFGINVAALITATILGIQPSLFHEPNGHALYFPFGLGITIPAIMLPHLAIAGIAEAVVTVLGVRYLQTAGIPLYDTAGNSVSRRESRVELMWIGLAALAALCPIGLLARGEAWGEWSVGGVAARAGYVPGAAGKIAENGWKGFGLLPDYLSAHGPMAYAIAAIAGTLIIFGVFFLISRILRVIGYRGELPEFNNSSIAPKDKPFNENLPDWLTASPSIQKPLHDDGQVFSPIEFRRPADYIERSLAGISESIRITLASEPYAERPGLLQRLDPRVKIASLFALVAVTSAVHRLPALLGLYGMATIFAVSSRISPMMLAKRVWLSVPLFTGAIALPAALNVITPGRPLVVLWHEPYLAITAPGVASAALLTVRVGVALSFVVLLTLTTRWHDLLRGLRVLLVPKAFIQIFTMTYRYVSVMLHTAGEYFVARKSRMTGLTAAKEGRLFAGARLGALFCKSVALTDEVHSAMISRGWIGETRTLATFSIRRRDVLWMATITLLCVVIMLTEFA